MAGNIPSLKPKEVIKILEHLGFCKFRQKGSHLIMVSNDSKCQPVIPIHNKDLKTGTLLSIIRQIGLTKEEFFKLRKSKKK